MREAPAYTWLVSSVPVTPARRPSFVVRPASGWRLPNARELWPYRDLLLVLAWRDLKLRYSQAVIGVAWVVLQPLLGATILVLIFGRFVGGSGDRPYVLIVFAGFVFWLFFSGAVQRASSSIVLDAKLITKVYFPRVIIPLASIVAALIDLLIGLAVVAVLMAYHGVVPGWQLAALPLLVVLGVAMAMGVGLWLAALNVKYRDFMYAAPFLLQVWLYASPVVYESEAIPDRWRTLYALNPVAGWIDSCRWALLGTSVDTVAVVLSIGITAVVLFSGVLFFHGTERSMADVI
ncbi:MAG TPA: ABC transporter permease [Thermoanaerobaculia bacterium]|nr:ABC transporter permease [Thermoanaerobaculia bacterium]